VDSLFNSLEMIFTEFCTTDKLQRVVNAAVRVVSGTQENQNNDDDLTAMLKVDRALPCGVALADRVM